MKSTIRKIIIIGASGFLGRLLAEGFNEEFEVILISRNPTLKVEGCRTVVWDAIQIGSWTREFEGAKAIINLCGKSVNCRYTEENKKLIISSRTETAHLVSKAIKGCEKPPKVWLNASSATIYESSFDYKQMESSGTFGDDFSPTVCKKWEEALFQEDLPKTIQVALRMALVLDRSGGVLPEFLKLVRQGLGGRQGSGKQMVSWISSNDLIRSVHFLIDRPKQRSVNICSPNPITNTEFMKWVRSLEKVPFGLPIAPWMVKIGGYLKQTEAELLLKSRFVYPEVLLQSGFIFEDEYLPIKY